MSCCSGNNQASACSESSFSTCCSSGESPIKTSQNDIAATQTAVRNLVNLIKESPEFIEFNRISEVVNKDPEVKKITRLIRLGGTAYDSSDDDDQAVNIHLVQLESLPVMVEYRKSENQVRQMFKSVDEIVSTSLGIPFAVNARISGCG